MGRVLLGLLVLLLSACSFEALGPGLGSLDFTVRALGAGQWREQPEVQARGEAGRIVVNAQFSAPDPCRTVSAELDRAGSELTLRVSIRPDDSQGCIAAIGNFEYDAVIRALPARSYHLRVIHSYPGTGWPTVTALDRTVTVQ